ncbi:MAG: hypothetical protein ACR2LT_05730 [Pyrinomonadaceae bacterium]
MQNAKLKSFLYLAASVKSSGNRKIYARIFWNTAAENTINSLSDDSRNFSFCVFLRLFKNTLTILISYFGLGLSQPGARTGMSALRPTRFSFNFEKIL